MVRVSLSFVFDLLTVLFYSDLATTTKTIDGTVVSTRSAFCDKIENMDDFDLLKPLAGSKSVSLDKTARVLASTKVETLAAPLHTRAQERLDRQAAYDATKEEVEKWAPTMKRIREVGVYYYSASSQTHGHYHDEYRPSISLSPYKKHPSASPPHPS